MRAPGPEVTSVRSYATLAPMSPPCRRVPVPPADAFPGINSLRRDRFGRRHLEAHDAVSGDEGAA